MKLPNGNTPDSYDSELDELIFLEGLNILVEGAANGDEFARTQLEEIALQLSEAEKKLSS